MEFEELVNQNYDSLTANEREIITAIFRDRQKILEMNSTQLSSFLHISRTTLVRLMKKLGIDTYAEFKILLDRKKGTSPFICDLEDVIQEYHLMIEELKKSHYEKICGLLYDAHTIYLYGTGNEQKTIAEEFKRIFLTFGKCCVDLYDEGEVEFARERFEDHDLFLAISLSGENREAVRVVRAVQEAMVPVISLTRWANNTLARMCRENLYVGTKTVSPASGRSYEMVAAFYILLDILSVRYLEFVHRHEGGPACENRGTSERSI